MAVGKGFGERFGEAVGDVLGGGAPVFCSWGPGALGGVGETNVA